MENIVPQPVPQKQCTQCLQWFDATPENFHRDKTHKDGLRSACQKCCFQTKYGQEMPSQDPTQKQCSQCGQYYKFTAEHFPRDKHATSGFRSNCKICDEKRRARYKGQPYHIARKQCTICQKWYDATHQYFSRAKYQPDKLSIDCRECQQRQKEQKPKRATHIEFPEITLICYTCRQVFQRRQHPPRYNSKGEMNRVYCPIHSSGKIRKIDTNTLAESYQAGKTIDELANYYQCSATTVRYYLNKMNIPIRPSHEHLIVSMRKNGHPRKGIRLTEDNKKKIGERSKQTSGTPEARARMSQQTIQMLVDGKFPFVSKLENRVAQELTKQGITFTRQYGITIPGTKGFAACIDFMLDDGRAIEVNGSYWHADPREYPNGPIYDRQRKKVESDQKKQHILAELGIPLITLWEIDLNADLAGTISKALSQ